MTKLGWTSAGQVDRCRRRRLRARRRADRRGGGGAARRDAVGPRAHVLDERQLQRARPRPELADGQGRHRLEGRDEAVQPLSVEPARAAPDQLEGQRVDARQPGELVRRDRRKAPKERGWQVVVDVAGGRRDDVKVVEQPLGRWCDAGSPRRTSSASATYTSRSARMCSFSRRRCAPPLPPRRRASERRAARCLACSSSNSIPSSSSPPAAGG